MKTLEEKLLPQQQKQFLAHLPGMLDAAMPELPGATGGAIPMGEGKGGAVPGMRLP